MITTTLKGMYMDNQAPPRTMMMRVAVAAKALGCPSDELDRVWWKLGPEPLPLTAYSFVLQVANAMEGIGLTPDHSKIEEIAQTI